jgi:V8-like Glu-specific endopeptidase
MSLEPALTGGRWVQHGRTIVVDLEPGSARALDELQEEVPLHRALTARDVMDPRIDVPAQYALMRLSKRSPAERAAAAAMLDAVRSGRLAGIYKEDQRVPALRAQGMGRGWWQLLRLGQDATIVVDRNPAVAPILIFRNAVRSNPARLDPALLAVWAALLRFFSGGFPVLVRHPVRGYVWVTYPGLAAPPTLRTVSALAPTSPLPPQAPLTYVANTTRVPNRWICHLEMDFGQDPGPPLVMGKKIIVQGTGLLIGRRHVLTAGHCLLTHFGPTTNVLGSPISPIQPVDITVTPALNGDKEPFPKINVSGKASRTSARWSSSNATDNAADFGLITLPQPLDSKLEFWARQNTRIAALKDKALQGKKLTAAGYPSHKCPPVLPFPLVCPTNGFLGTSQWQATGDIVSLDPDTLEYLVESDNGMSGGPVWMDDGKLLHLAGIHARKLVGPPGVRAGGVRVTAKLLREVGKWMRADGALPGF